MKNKRKIVSLIIVFIITMLISLNVFATEITDLIGTVEYSEEYKNWLKLSDEEKKEVIQPRMFNIPKENVEVKNPLKKGRLLRSALSSKYSLQEDIPENIVVKNQQQTNSCWTFGSLASLETNLALKNYYNGNSAKVYDFSERHMEYATSREFLNGEINTRGFNRKIDDGGNSYLYSAYLTNGMGAINEKDMPFESKNELISLNSIQDKEVTSQVYDIEWFPSYNQSDDLTQIKQQMKEYIKNYGAIEVGVHGSDLSNKDCYNNKTGAIYCDSNLKYKINHSVAIIGWDDNYSVNNFNEKLKPKNNGAWIIKNSWGTEITTTFDELKIILFKNYKDKCIENGWNEASDIPDSIIEEFLVEEGFNEENGYAIQDRKVIQKVGDKGMMYVSYEDANIYMQMFGISSSSDTVNYENIYQYNEYGYSDYLPLISNKFYIGNIFDKKTTEIEDLTEVSISSLEKVTCKVYVNPNGTSKSKDDLQLVQLKAGESETFGAGYHTLEFLEPLRINGDSFAVVVEMQSQKDTINVPVEAKIEDSIFEYVQVENNKCYIATEDGYNNGQWENLSTFYTTTEGQVPNCDSTIKAFTVKGVEDDSLNNIEIATPATKLEYNEGEDFDKTGMIVKANYNNGKSDIIENYEIKDGTNLKASQTFVTISYEGKSVKQSIVVTKEGIEKPKNSNFDNVKCKVLEIKTNGDNNDEYFSLVLELSGIEKSNVYDKLDYYYWLSSNPKETDIDKWIKIDSGEIVDGKLKFTINSKDIPNYQEVSTSEALYLYIKERATKGEAKIETITSSMKVELANDFEDNTDKKDVDNTVAKKELPNTGVRVLCITILSVMIIFVIIKFIKYRDLKDIK